MANRQLLGILLLDVGLRILTPPLRINPLIQRDVGVWFAHLYFLVFFKLMPSLLIGNIFFIEGFLQGSVSLLSVELLMPTVEHDRLRDDADSTVLLQLASVQTRLIRAGASVAHLILGMGLPLAFAFTGDSAWSLVFKPNVFSDESPPRTTHKGGHGPLLQTPLLFALLA